MKIKNKILLSSSLMMLLSLITLLVVGGFVIRSFASAFSDDSVNLVNKNAFTVEDQLASFDAEGGEWEPLKEMLAQYQYELFVIRNKEAVFPMDDQIPKEITSFLSTGNWMEEPRTINVAGITIVGMREGEYTIAAIHGKRVGVANIHRNIELILKSFVIIGIAAIAIILLISQVFTNWLIKRVMRPVNALAAGANRIVQGNLSEPVIYKGKDELAAVIATFNQMQAYLLEERRRNASFEKARTDMIAGISHDLRTPLTSVKGYIKGLRDGVASTPEKQEQYLSIAYNKASEMDALLQKLFYFSKLETGNLPLTLIQEDLGQFVRKYVTQNQAELSQRNTAINVNGVELGHFVSMDAEQMNRVLTNLIDNSIKYARAEMLDLNLSVWREKDNVHLSVSDNGQGVPEEQLANLFVQFWRGDESRGNRDGGGGSGLGLNIVKHIVEAHGGTVSARNENGLVVDVILPAGKEG
ncbi:HAMP domain-containing histidine kinase [Anoxybacterium hadale]|uniref:HAMP domain-containing histidine kinase n=1 Tax=Anoxybacterium hadale TaxID=3408580 RepID=A0ACD1AFH0_9FIRM|nr:HAMP domain-containing histidine kinase [Clostridiales bacterium]